MTLAPGHRCLLSSLAPASGHEKYYFALTCLWTITNWVHNCIIEVEVCCTSYNSSVYQLFKRNNVSCRQFVKHFDNLYRSLVMQTEIGNGP